MYTKVITDNKKRGVKEAGFNFNGCFRKTIQLVLKTSTENPATTRKCIIMIFLVTKKVRHEIFMSINSFMILTYCLSDLINLIRFQFYYRPRRLMMARVIVLLACIFILSKSKLLLVVGRNFIQIKFFLKLSGFFCEVL